MVSFQSEARDTPIVKRREFVALLGGAAATWPLVSHAQQAPTPTIGSLTGHSRTSFVAYRTAFERGLAEIGFVEGRNLAIEYRYAEGQYDRMPEMAAELVRRQIAVMVVTGGGAQPVLISNMATTIPVVFVTGADPVSGGIVQSLNRPGRNVTGVYQFASAMDAKRLGMLREIVPTARAIGVLANPTYAQFETQLKEVEQAAGTLGLAPHVLRASTQEEIDAAFAGIAAMRAEALLVCADPFFNSRRNQIVALAARYAIPAIYEQREFTESGGLVSYGASIRQAYTQAGVYTGRILKGEKPADLPVAQTTRFELVINLVVAKAFRLVIPPHVLALADEVIE
jgi:putative ABC transport system substrate-binding protein